MMSSEEIRTMISALGTGIGDQEYDIKRLRYHKVIIMTDADVDGAHIRTLLLTFFFRQMPELIDKGHLYVAQPPLYRIADGKKELYVREEESFNEFIIRRIADKEKVFLEDGTVISGKKLSMVLRGLITYYENVEGLVRKGYGERFIEFLATCDIKERDAFKDKTFMEGLFRKLQDNGFQVSDIRLSDTGHDYYEFVVVETRNGGQGFFVDWEMFTSPELKRLLEISRQLQDLRGKTFKLGGEGEAKGFDSWQALLEDLMSRGKSGLSIQRYKGLGEMNPTQLWDTTMDPAKRSLLQVKVEDVVEADEIFGILMGDQVEPRRDFIYANALEVKELDI
jgi:DNA gyrase subunit B